MFSKEIETLLHKNIGVLPLLICNRSIKNDIDDLTQMVFQSGTLAVIDDKYTSGAMGDMVARALSGKFSCTHIMLDGTPTADEATANYIRQKTSSCDALVAVGGGTINDLCKYASFLDGKPYIVFPTAASMNGYLSANASITVDGYKKTLPAQMPKAVFCDVSVIAGAPARLSKSGLGDCLARPTAQADWLLSHLVLNTPYNEIPFELLASLEPHLFDSARGIASGDPASIELLMRILLLSGLGMTIAGGSHPASQGEHMIAHAYEMSAALRVHSAEKSTQHSALSTQHSLHGEQIGVTSLYMAQMQEALLRRPPALLPTAFDGNKITALFGAHVTAEAKKSYRKKQEALEEARLSTDALTQRWGDIAGRIEAVTLPSQRIAAVLKAANAPDTVEKLGWNDMDYAEAAKNARFLRERFTCLDLKVNNS